MNISIDNSLNTNSNKYLRNPVRSHNKYFKELPNDIIHFKGNISQEKVGNLVLKHQTSFFREINTLKNLVEYLKSNFDTNKPFNILVGACSTGEEATSIKMLLGNLKANIKAFDLGENAIKKAQSGIYEISEPLNKDYKDYMNKYAGIPFEDSFLCFADEELTVEQKELKEMFDKNFEFVSNKSDKKLRLSKRMKTFILNMLGCYNKFNFLKTIAKCLDNRLNHYLYRLKDPQGIEYVTGNILNLADVTKGKKYQAITFRNALYHLTTQESGCLRFPKSQDEQINILNKIVKQINNSLENNGIFVIGEDEIMQMTNVDLLSEILKKNGFTRILDKNNKPINNIWKK